MNKTTTTNKTRNSKVVRAGAILSALLMVLLPSTGVGNFASVAYAVTNDQDTSLSTFTVDGTTVTDGAVVDVAYGTTAVDVVAIPTNEDAVVAVTGEDTLDAGANTVSVLVTAADDVTTQTYSVTVNVAKNNDTSLGVFTVNGDDVLNGGSVSLAYGTTEVDVVAEASDVEATVVISGDTALVSGANTLEVIVTADDGTTTQTYSVTLNVAENDDASLGVFAVNGDDVVDGSSVSLAFGTTEVEVVAEPTDVEATVVISGEDALVSGPNTLQIVVTAADGTTTQTYTVTLNVAENTDASLAVFAVNGNDVTDGGTVNLDWGTTEVEVIAEATDDDAVVVITGGSSLSTGSNTLTITVTAADGTTTQTYTVTLLVAQNDDVTLAVFAINGEDVTNGSTVTVANGTTSVTVIAEATDPDATVLVTGGTALQTGNNTVTIDVTAANGGNIASYIVTVVVSAPAFSNDTSLQTFTVDGSNVVDGGSVTIAQGRTSVEVAAVPTNQYATAVISGNTGLQPGPNTISVTVTADDGTVKVYTVTVTVNIPSSDATISSVKIDGSNFTVNENGSSVYNASFGTQEVTVAVTTSSNTATFTVTGEKNLVVGDNTVTIAVEAEDGTDKTYTFKIAVAAANTNTGISSFQINGSNVSAGDTVDLLFGTTDVTVDVETAAPTSTFAVTGSSSIPAGTSTLTVTVTAQSGATATYSVTLNVLPASSVKTITGITVNGLAVTANAITLTAGTTEAEVVVSLANEFANYTISGTSTVTTGVNTRTITVTAQDGSTENTTLTITVPEASTDNTLASITVDTDVVAVGGTVSKANGTSSVVVVATANSDKATVVVSGADVLLPGLNTVTITVTAESGASATYTFTVDVAKSSNKAVSSILVNNTEVSVSRALTVSVGTTDVEVSAVTADPDASYSVSGNTSLVAGVNTVTVTVTAQDGSTQAYDIAVTVPVASTDNTLASITVDGATVTAGSTVSKPNGTSAVTVVAVPNSESATVVVAGEDVLVPGLNTITITVTAESGASATYTFTVDVAKSNNVGLSSILVENQEVKNTLNFTATLGATEVEVSAVTSDPDASYSVSGNTGLQGGSNSVVITVTAADGSTAQYTVVVTVPVLSANANLSSVTINGFEVNPAGGFLSEVLPNGTTSVIVVATPDDENATVAVSGEDVLVPGLNTIYATVTAQSGATATYEYTVEVARSSNTGVSSILVDNTEVSVTKAITVPIGSTEVEVSAVTADPDASYAVTGSTGLVAGANNVTVTVTAANGATQAYVIVVTVPTADTDNTLASITVDGATVEVGGSVSKANGTESVVVVATANSEKATVVVAGADALVSGANTVTVTVTAESGAAATYTFTVNVALSADNTLDSITVNGIAVAVGEVLTVSDDTTSVIVVATANDADATVSVSGADALVPGDNTVTVTVTAANGAVQAYTFKVRLPIPSNNANLSFFNVNGVDALENESVDVATDVIAAEIIAQTEEANATYAVTSSTALVVGANTITVVVTAPDGVTTRTYSVTVNRAAPLSGDTSLASLTVNEAAISVGDTVDVGFGVESVAVVATATNANATALVSGATGLKTGSNVVLILVTAENGATAEYTFTVVVAASNDNSLSGITVNGSSISLDDLSFTVASGTTSVAVAATPNDVDASYSVSGQDELEFGPNTVTITVTAADGSTREYLVVVTRTPLSGNNNIDQITVNGETVAVDGTYEVDFGTTSVEVLATAEDSDAAVAVSDASALVTGNNVITITITAANGSEATYQVNVFVKSLSNDTSLKVFTVDGTNVEGEAFSITLDGTKNFVSVVAQANHPNAVVSIEGTTDLSFGENDILVTVTAEDGTVATYSFVAVFPNIGDTSLTVFTINGTTVDDGDRVELPYGITDVEVVTETTDPEATAEVTGAEGLVPGENELIVSVTARDGETIQEYLVIVFVAFNTDSSLTSFQVNGEDVTDGQEVLLPAYTTEVEVTAEPTDPEATVEINGATELNVGENLLIVTVTAADGVSATDYVITLTVPLGNNVELASFTVAGNDVADGDTFDLEPYTFNPEILVETADPDATFTLTGGTDLVVGPNTIVVVVTAADGTTSATYTVTLNLPLGNNVELASFQVNGADAADGDTVTVDYGTTEVDVVVTTVDPDATVEIVGGTELQPGENTLTVNVTAADGETTGAYTVTVVVSLNNDASLAVFAVNGADVVDGETVELEYGVTSVEVLAEPTDPDATVEISGNTDLVSGENTLTVTVTAADGETSAEYQVLLKVAFNSDTSLAVFQVNGVDVVDGGSIDLPAYTTDAEVTVETTDADATVEIEGGTELVSGENTVTVTVTAADQETVTVYTVTLVVALGNDVTFSSFQINGEDIEDGGSITVSAALTSVEVVLELTDPDASYEVSGADNLTIGLNVITVVVRAADNSTTATYTATVVVLSNDTSLAEFTVNGSPVDDGDYFELELGTTSVEVVVAATDEGATFEVDGGQDLQPGENTLTVTVTAADGETTKEYVVTLFVLLSTDTSLSTFKVNGVDVEDGSDVELPPYTTDVEVEVVATDADAQVDIAGADSLQAGENRLEVTVTAADGETIQIYTVFIFVIFSTEVGVSEIIVNGESVQSGEVVLSLDLELTEVDVEVVAIDENATIEISGNTELVKGDNLINILVTAQSGDVGEYSVIFRLGGLPGNPKLKSLIVAGNTIDLTAVDPTITVPAGTRSVSVIPTAEEEAASIRVTGNTNLVAGDNLVTVKVTATDGKTTREYVVKVTVLTLSSNTNLSSIRVNGSLVAEGGTATLVPGAKFAEVVAVAEDSAATVSYSGTKNLVAGNNTATITVRAANGSTATYTVVLAVPSLSNDTSLKVLSIEGFNMLNKTKLSVPAGTTKLRITAQANSAGASVSIAGRDIKAGVNFVVITVTAADGTVATYTVRVKA